MGYEQSNKIFVGRIEIKKVKGKHGDWDITRISLGPNDFERMQEFRENGWINLLLKTGKSGNKYLEVDTWKPNSQTDSNNDLLPEDVF